MKEKILMIVFVLVLGSILTTALVAVDDFTAPFIERNSALKLKSSVLGSLDIPFKPEDTNEIEGVFAANIEVKKRDEKSIYISKGNDIAFQFSGAGLWGPITGVLALQPDIKTIKKIVVIHQEETPGLGGRIAEQIYLDGFVNKSFSPHLLLVPEGTSSLANEIDAIAGATMSSDAFVEILNDQFEKYRSTIQGEL